MQLSQKEIPSSHLFAFLKFTTNSEYFEKKYEARSLSISKIIDWKSGDYFNVQKKSCFGTPFESQLVNRTQTLLKYSRHHFYPSAPLM